LREVYEDYGAGSRALSALQIGLFTKRAQQRIVTLHLQAQRGEAITAQKRRERRKDRMTVCRKLGNAGGSVFGNARRDEVAAKLAGLPNHQKVRGPVHNPSALEGEA